MFKSKLFLEAFSIAIVLIAIFSFSIYFISVPLINKTVNELEENSAKTVLDSVYNMSEKIYLDIESNNQSLLESRKRELKNIVLVAESYIKNLQQQVKQGLITEPEAQKKILEEMRAFKYGHNDYIWIVDFNSFTLSHPDPKFHGTDFSKVKDVNGRPVVPPMVEIARKKGEGYYSYWWKKLGKDKSTEKLSYFKLIPQWQWVLGTGIYIDDLSVEIEKKKERAIEDLRQILKNIKIGTTGYIYIFDSKMNVIIHPNKNLEGANAAALKNPLSGKPLFQELMAASQREDNKLLYKWDRPEDTDNYIYEKISWVRYLKGFDWYIGSSVYTAEFHKNSQVLQKRLVAISLIIIFLSFGVGYFFVRRLVNPIRELSRMALKVKGGDLTVRSEINRKDEVGELAKSFNAMVEQLRTNIETLEQRSEELEKTYNELKEMHAVVPQTLDQLFESAKDYHELKKLDEMKSSFLSTVSHELRTPLTSVLGFAKIIKNKFENVLFPLIKTDDHKVQKTIKQVIDNLHIIVSEGERLTTLINDVLDLAKMEAGKIEWKREPLAVTEIIDRATAATSSLFEQKNLEMKKMIGPELPEIVGDRDRLIQVVINLISNAVKFTDQGSITCSATRINQEIVVCVSDTGMGIAKENQEKVFEKFKQIGDTMTDKPKGTGLGLPICKQIIEHHGGRIWVESEWGRGSNFLFSLPVREQAEITDLRIMDVDTLVKQLRDHVVTAAPTSRAGGKTVLVVDDDLSIRRLLRQELEAESYRVKEAADGMEALNQVKKERPDLIILDVMMPGMSGFDVAAVLKHDPITMGIPIVILSVIENKERGYKIGVDRYFTKPVDMEGLLREIGELLSLGTSKKKVLVVDENVSTVKTLAEVLEAKGYSVVGAYNGAECIEKAIKEKPDMIIVDALISDHHDITKTLRFEKGLENVYFILLAESKAEDPPKP
jgi:signal transduction histidine kinase/CheY-like chemotaxis protein